MLYDLKLTQNAADHTVAVDASDETIDVAVDELCVITVTGASGAEIDVLEQVSSGLVTEGTIAGNGQLKLFVIKLTFNVTDGSTTNAVDCSGDTASTSF